MMDFRSDRLNNFYRHPSGKSYLRVEVESMLESIVGFITDPWNDVIDVGIAGDEERNPLFVSKNLKTLDINPLFKPDIVADICDTKLPPEICDLICLSQCLEHMYEPMKAVKESHRLLRENGWIIITVPWNYPYHAECGFGDYWRISADSLKLMLSDFSIIHTVQKEFGAYGWARK